MLRHWWSNPPTGWLLEEFLALAAGQPAGHAECYIAPAEVDPERWGRFECFLVPAAVSPQRLHDLFAFVEDRLTTEGALAFEAEVWEDDAPMHEALAARGYLRDRVEKNWELDLVELREEILARAEKSRARMREQGIRCLTLAEDHDPDHLVKLHALTEAVRQDIPHTTPLLPKQLEDFERELDAPYVHWDRYWIARDGDRIVGHSFLCFPPEIGPAWTCFTGVAREYRGRGIAQALKLFGLAQAIELGVRRVRTDNDGENLPILHINETLGYRQVEGWATYLKRD